MLSLLASLFNTDDTMWILLILFARIFVFVCCLPVHESAHAWMAYKLGDDTGRLSGRITLNPLKHLNVIGTLMILLLGFGYAKPVPVNIGNFPPKKRKFYFALTAAAGPISNLLLAVLFILLELICKKVVIGSGSIPFYIAELFFRFTAQINISLAVFNLIPIPPLDGSRLVTAVLPDRIYYKLMNYERYFMIGLFALILVLPRFLNNFTPLSTLTAWIYNGINYVLGLPFGFGK